MTQRVLTTSAGIQVRWISEPAEWKQLKSFWSELLSNSSADAIFLCWDWLDTWLEVYGDGGTWVILTATGRDGVLIGVAPMMLDRGTGLGGKWLRRLLMIGQKADTASEFLDWILRKGFEQPATNALCQFIFSNLADLWDILLFNSMRADSAMIPMLVAEGTCRKCFPSVTKTTTAPYVTLAPTWDAFLNQQRGKFRQRWNKFHRDHSVTIRLAGRDMSVADGMAKIRQLNESRWGHRRQSFLSERYIRFHDRVAERLHKSGHLLLIFIEADGEIVAGRYDFAYEGKGWSFQGGWLPEWEKLSIGKMMLTQVMRWCIEHGLKEYDFLGGSASYKNEWSDGERAMVSIQAANPASIPGRLYLCLKDIRDRLRSNLDSRETQTITVQVIRSLDALQREKEVWTRLWRSHPRPEIFQHFGWSLAVAKAYQWEERLYVLLLRDADGLPVGICPWALSGGRISWLTSPRADYNDVVCAATDGPRVVEACLRHLQETRGRDWHEVLLEDVPDDSVWSTHIRSLKNPPLKIAAENPESCWSVQMDPDGTVLGGITAKKGYSRNEKALAGLGSVSLDEQITLEQRMAALPGFFDLHIARWAAAGKTSMFSEESSREFYRLLMQDSELAKLIDFTSLTVSGEPAAYHIGFWGASRFFVYKWCFDPARQKAGPGTVLMVRLMAHAVKRGFLEFDFLRGGEGYKNRFANKSHLSHDWRAFASPIRRCWHGAKARLRQRCPALARALGALSRGDVQSIRQILKPMPSGAVSEQDS